MPRRSPYAALFAQKLASSGLTPKQAKPLGITLLPPLHTKKLVNFRAPSLHIAYHNYAHQPTGYFRIRLLRPAEGQDGKPIRYLGPGDTTPEAYFATCTKWQDIISNPKQALYITEGELKAAKACIEGYPTIGLGGVASFQSSRSRQELLPTLKAIKWSGRPVYLIFDSDLQANPQVQSALERLADRLLHLGAQPQIVFLPELPECEKTGLDDYLVHQGPEALEHLVRQAMPTVQGQELMRLNGEVAYIKDPGLVVVQDTRQRISVDNFMRHAYAPRRFWIVGTKGNLIEKKAAKEWIEWPHRREYQNLVYRPGEPQVVGNDFNLWMGWGAEPKRGTIGPWERLMDLFFQKDDEARQWFQYWLASQFQRPGEKAHSAVLFYSQIQGVGKGLVGQTLTQMFGEPNISEISEHDLRSQYNGWAAAKQLIIGEEITNGDRFHHSMSDIKHQITRTEILVNAKYAPQFRLKDCANYLFSTNHAEAFALDEQDRRFFVHEITKRQNSTHYKQYLKWMQGSGPAYLHAHLLDVKLNGYDSKLDRPPMTAAKSTMVGLGRSDMGQWVADLMEEPGEVLPPKWRSRALFTSGELLLLYDPYGSTRATANGLARELKRQHAWPIGVVRTSLGSKRLWAIRDTDRWSIASPGALAEHYIGFLRKKV